MPPLDLLSGEFWVGALGYWAKDSERLYRLALIIAGLIGIPLLISRTYAANKSARAADAQARTAEQGHITDRFTAAVEQLGSDKMTVRLGAIYALERISRDSWRDHGTIMETLTAFVRERAKWPPVLANPFAKLQGSAGETAGKHAPEQPANEAEPASSQIRPATDIQAALTVLGHRGEAARKQDEAAERRLDLRDTDLRGALLSKAHLERAILVDAHLEGALLVEAHLEGADLAVAYLNKVAFWNADLKGAILQGADLTGADLRSADLSRRLGAFRNR
jgi:Pentapeptide repeats (8 copies)